MVRKRQSLVDRILDNTKIDGKCWIWQGAVGTSGYGQITGYVGDTKKNLIVHRAFYKETIDSGLPSDLVLDHICENKLCVNPEHLEPVSQRTNILRGTSPVAVNALKTKCSNGHLLILNNLYISRGRRECKACAHNRSNLGVVHG